MATYGEVRGKIKTGDVLAWTHRGGWFRSWHDFKVHLVRLFTRSEYSHVGVAVVLSGRVFVLEAVSTGIRLFPLSKCLPFYWIKYGNGLDLDKALSVYGEQYSQWEAVLGKLNKSDAENGLWQCSEYVAWMHSMRCSATPSAVVDYALANGGVMQVVV